jgi:hypothetical protein
MEAFLNEPRATHDTFNLNSDAPSEFHDCIRAADPDRSARDRCNERPARALNGQANPYH